MTESNALLSLALLQMIFDGGDWLCGGDIEVLDRIFWNDGLDKYRLTPKELRLKFRELNVSSSSAKRASKLGCEQFIVKTLGLKAF